MLGSSRLGPSRTQLTRGSLPLDPAGARQARCAARSKALLTRAEHHGDYRMKVSGLSKMYKEEADAEAAAEDGDEGDESSTGDSDARAKIAAQAGHVQSGETNRDGKTKGRDEDGAQVAKSGLSGPSKSCVCAGRLACADRHSTMDIARSHVASNSTKDNDGDDDVQQTNPKEVVAARKAHDAGEAEDAKKDEKDSSDDSE